MRRTIRQGMTWEFGIAAASSEDHLQILVDDLSCTRSDWGGAFEPRISISLQRAIASYSQHSPCWPSFAPLSGAPPSSSLSPPAARSRRNKTRQGRVILAMSVMPAACSRLWRRCPAYLIMNSRRWGTLSSLVTACASRRVTFATRL